MDTRDQSCRCTAPLPKPDIKLRPQRVDGVASGQMKKSLVCSGCGMERGNLGADATGALRRLSPPSPDGPTATPTCRRPPGRHR